MATLRQFEQLLSWQAARVLAKEIYAFTAVGAQARDFELRRQLRSAAVSAMANIAEGFDRGGSKEFIHFLTIARGSAAEVRSLLYVALDQDYLDQTTFDQLYEQTQRVTTLASGLCRYLERTRHKGLKFKQYRDNEKRENELPAAGRLT